MSSEDGANVDGEEVKARAEDFEEVDEEDQGCLFDVNSH